MLTKQLDTNTLNFADLVICVCVLNIDCRSVLLERKYLHRDTFLENQNSLFNALIMLRSLHNACERNSPKLKHGKQKTEFGAYDKSLPNENADK